jgi:hypothetical protein
MTTNETARGVNIFDDLVTDAERVALEIRMMDGYPVTMLNLALLRDAIHRTLRSLGVVTALALAPGDAFDLTIERRVPQERARITFEFSMSDDVINGLEAGGFFDEFDAGEERARAFQAIKSMGEMTLCADHVGHSDDGHDLWVATGMNDVFMRMLLVFAGKEVQRGTP